MIEDQFSLEIDQASENAKISFSAILTDLGISEKGLNYVLGQSFYRRVPGLFCVWIADKDRRIKASELMIIHCIGLKMVDDIIDDDHGIENSDLFLGVQLMQYAVCKMHEMSPDSGINNLFLEQYQVIYRDICKSKGRGVLENSEAWLKSASIQGGSVFSTYGLAALMIDGSGQSRTAVSDFCIGFGRLVVLLDDFVDYIERDERGGNIAHLYRQGLVTQKEICDILEECLILCQSGFDASVCAHDISQTVGSIADRTKKIISTFEAEHL